MRSPRMALIVRGTRSRTLIENAIVKIRGRRRDGLGLADALVCHRYRGALERRLSAHHSIARTGPYDTIFDTVKCEDREVARRLEPLLPALRLLHRLHCFLSTFRHCCPPSHENMAGVASARAANRHALHFVYYSTTKKTVSRLTKRVRGASFGAQTALSARAFCLTQRCMHARRRIACKSATLQKATMK